MKIRYIYSATVVIETDDCTILCDPWWTPAYEGSWVQYPVWARSMEEAIEVCGEAQYIFISHVHPDHYDPAFLRAYLATYPTAKVIIAQQDPPLLERKLRSRGIEPVVVPVTIGLTVGSITLWALANRANAGMNIDSALVVSDGHVSVANLNDNPYDANQVEAITLLCPGLHPTVALLPFVGAGPWPQCYEMDSDVRLMAALAKKQKYLQLFRQYCEALQPKVAVPFAGQYWLHGERLHLNQLRGMADATECEKMYPGRVWVPADGGQSYYQVGSHASGERRAPYDWPTVRPILNKEIIPHLRYEREIQVPVERLPLLKLLQSATQNAFNQFRAHPRSLHVYIKTQLPQWFYLYNYAWLAIECGEEQFRELEPRVEVYLDARLLFGMLTRLYNANSVRIGSLCRFKVVPLVYDKELDDLFGEFWDSLRV